MVHFCDCHLWFKDLISSPLFHHPSALVKHAKDLNAPTAAMARLVCDISKTIAAALSQVIIRLAEFRQDAKRLRNAVALNRHRASQKRALHKSVAMCIYARSGWSNSDAEHVCLTILRWPSLEVEPSIHFLLQCQLHYSFMEVIVHRVTSAISTREGTLFFHAPQCPFLLWSWTLYSETVMRAFLPPIAACAGIVFSLRGASIGTACLHVLRWRHVKHKRSDHL